MPKKPYLIFGGQGQPRGGLADYVGAHFTKDEAAAQLAALQLAWWSLMVFNDDGLQEVAKSGEEKAESKKRKTSGSLEGS